MNLDDIPDVDLSFVDAGFYSRLASASFADYLRYGIGATFFTERPDMNRKEDIIEDFIDYIPLTKKTAPRFTVQALKMINQYDPKKEVVFVSEYNDGQVEVRKMGKSILGILPINAYRRSIIASGKGRFIPGELIILKKPIDKIPKGHYVFIKRSGAFMELAALKNGNLIKSEITVHSDFEEIFKGTGDVVRG